MFLFRKFQGDRSRGVIEAPPTIAHRPEPAAATTVGVDEAHTRIALDMIESDVKMALERLAGLIDSSRTMSEETTGDLGSIHTEMSGLSAAAGTANRDVAGLAAATAQVSTNVELVSQNADSARQRIALVADHAGRTRDVLNKLVEASGEIVGISETIAAVARQTNLLALNATIEASRAGEAGRAFAIVASEVKTLSVATSDAVEGIRQRIGMLEQATRESVSAIGDIVRMIQDVNPMVATISQAMQEQANSAAELSRRAHDAAGFVETVAGQVAHVDTLAVVAAKRSSVAAITARKSAAEAQGLALRFVPVIRQTSFADRRRRDRLPVERPVLLATASRRWQSTTIDIGEGGCLIARPDDCTLRAGDSVRFSIEAGEMLEARVAAVSVLGLHCAAEGSLARQTLGDLSKAVEGDYRPLIDRAVGIANEITAAFETLLDARTLNENTLFDTQYAPVPGTDPEQFETSYLPLLKRVLPPIQEKALDLDKRLVFCLAIDRNGYIPVHNAIYSQPQRPGDPVWNAANSRDRRMFNDRTGIIAARSVRPFVVQAYRRDMGGGQFVMMREIDVPLAVRGRHWGGLRMAYRF